MVRFVGSMNNIIANKVTIIMHIVAYLFIIIVNPLQLMLYQKGSLRANETSTICYLVVYFVCTLIFGLIVNTIVTKIENATSFAESTSSSLMNLETGSFAGQQNPRHSVNDIEVEETEGYPEPLVRFSIDFVEKGSVSEGIITTLFRQSDQ